MSDEQKSMDYIAKNREQIDAWVNDGWVWGTPISHEMYQEALEDNWAIYVTPVKPVPREWMGELKGAKVLGLASGGGQQMPILTARGAHCTIFDLSPRQLQNEREVAEREGYDIEIIEGDMTKPFPFADNCFDLIINPVSTCFIEDVEPVFREAFRVLKPGGIFVAGLDNGMNYLVDEKEERIIHGFPYNPLNDPELYVWSTKQGDGVQFSHTAEEQLGLQLHVGFQLTHIDEDTNGEGRLHEMGIPSFYRSRAIKPLT